MNNKIGLHGLFVDVAKKKKNLSFELNPQARPESMKAIKAKRVAKEIRPTILDDGGNTVTLMHVGKYKIA